MTSLIVNTHEAKSRLSELIRAAESGDDVIIARNGDPVAKLIKWPPPTLVRTPGSWSGVVSWAADEETDQIDLKGDDRRFAVPSETFES